jgi:hypothetical protein
MRFPSDEFDAAVAATCHGTASEELLTELTAVLRDQAASLDEYLWQKEIHARLATGHEFFVHDLLRLEHDGPASGEGGDRKATAGRGSMVRTDSRSKRRTTSRPTSRTWLAIGGMAALAGVVLAATAMLNPTWTNIAGGDARPMPRAVIVPPVVARLAELDGVGWVGADIAHAVGDTIRAGEKLELATGRLRLDFLCGASVWLTAPAIFEMESRQSARLTAGRVRVIASTPEAKGFTIHTRTASVVDLGTEFTAEATLDGRCRVDVTSGEVQVHLASSAVQHLLKAGDAMEVESGSAQVTARIESGDDSPAFRFPSIEPPSADDYADSSQGKATIECVKGQLYKGRKHESGRPELLLDGTGQSQPDSPTESVYFAREESGCLLLDLGSRVAVSKVNAYSWHRNVKIDTDHTRATQKYDLYGFAGDAAPGIEKSPVATGWTLIARVNTDSYFGRSRELRPAQQATSITAAGGSLGRFRYLLWVMQPTRDEAKPDDELSRNLDNSFFGEIDVYAAE